MNIIKQAITISRNYYDVSEEEFMGKSRKREIVQSRQVAMYMLKKHRIASLEKIGSACGGKDHTTVTYAIKTISNLIDTDKKIAREIKMMEDDFINNIDIEYTDGFIKILNTLKRFMKASEQYMRKDAIRKMFKTSEIEPRFVNKNIDYVDEELKYILGIT